MADMIDIDPLPSQDLNRSRAEIYTEANVEEWPGEGDSEEWPVTRGDSIVIFIEKTLQDHEARTSWTFASNNPKFGKNREIRDCLAACPTLDIRDEGRTEDEFEDVVDQLMEEAIPMSIEPFGEFIRRVKDHDPLVTVFVGIAPHAFESLVKRPDTTVCRTTSMNSPSPSKQSPTLSNTQQSDHRPVSPSTARNPVRQTSLQDGTLTQVGTEWETRFRRPRGKCIRVVARSKTPMDTQSIAGALSRKIHGWTESPGLSERPESGDQDNEGL